jgi:hypothetical protein
LPTDKPQHFTGSLIEAGFLGARLAACGYDSRF